MSFHLPLMLAACLLGSEERGKEAGSYLRTVFKAADGTLSEVVEVYIPHPGDLVMYDDHSKIWDRLYRMVGTEPPDHSGIVIDRLDGTPAVLESGPDNGIRVRILDLYPRFQNYPGTIYIRRVRAPLTPEKTAELTQFALAQEGKRYAWGRLLLQGTPCKCREGWRADYFAKTYLDRSSWLCSELVVAAGTVAGLFDPNIHKANRIYPRDIIDDNTYDLIPIWHLAGMWSRTPERWHANGQ